MQKKIFFFSASKHCYDGKIPYLCGGEMAEWSNAAVLKTVEPQGSGGSNPSFSASEKQRQSLINQIINGEMPEWSNGAVSKTVDLGDRVLGFESLSLRKQQSPVYISNTQGFMFQHHHHNDFFTLGSQNLVLSLKSSPTPIKKAPK